MNVSNYAQIAEPSKIYLTGVGGLVGVVQVMNGGPYGIGEQCRTNTLLENLPFVVLECLRVSTYFTVAFYRR